jgi:ectoine hydroxylase-related dioxygenase (phytanoyl-CoA dioxygenase family)
MAEEWREFRVSNDARGDTGELRRRISDEGYLFFRALVDPEAVIALRRDIMKVLAAEGWLCEGTEPLEGIVDLSRRCTEGDLPYSRVYNKVQCLESFHRLPHDPALMETVEAIFGTRAIPVPGNKARIWFPKFTEHTTPMHQDFVHYQGSLQALTFWSPVGDCPVELGPLAVLPRSHTVRKVLPHHFSLGAGGLIIRLEEEVERHPQLDVPWHTTNFQAGDALFFPALTVHKAMPNLTEDRLRVSLDNRYQREGDAIAAHMLVPHMSDVIPLGWEEVYRGWKSDELKYYWTRMRHREIPRYMGYMKKGFAEAMELARAGDQKAILAMRRAVRIDPSSSDGKAARAVLEEIGAAL